MAQRKTVQPQHLGSTVNPPSAQAAEAQAPIYGICPKHPGKLVQRLADGTEIVGRFVDGKFVPEQ